MSEIAKKHIAISVKSKDLAVANCSDSLVYIATYTTGRSGQSYQRLEQESGEEFWSIKAWTSPPHGRLKDPDVIITHGERVKFLVEVKWGAVPGRPSTDLHIGLNEWGKMDRLLCTSTSICRVKGPAVKDGRRYKNIEFLIEKDYRADSESKLILVSDFAAVKESLNSKFQQFLKLWKSASPSFLIADINIHVDKIPSFAEVLAG